MKHIKTYEKFDIINNDLKHDIKEYLLINYPSDWWINNGNLEYVINNIKEKFLLSEYEYERNKIEDIIETHMNNMMK